MQICHDKANNNFSLIHSECVIGSLCKDPKHFMGQHDLLAMIQHHESNDDHTFALTTLTVCSLGEHVRKRQIRRLIDIATESNVQNIGEIVNAKIEIFLNLFMILFRCFS